MTDVDVIVACQQYVIDAKARAADGLTWSEFGELAVGLMRLGVRLADTMQAPGPEKRDIVLYAVGLLFDGVATHLIPWPVWFVAKPVARRIVLQVASGVLEQLLPLVRATEK